MAYSAVAAAGVALGSGASASLAGDSSDKKGTITFTAGSSGTTTGVLGTLTLGGNYSSGVDESSQVVPFFTPLGSASSLGISVSAVTTQRVTFSCTTAPSVSASYSVAYHIDT